MTSTLRIGMLIHQNSRWLGSDLVKRADDALSAHEDRKYTDAVVNAGACLEGMLKKMLQEWGITTEGDPTLGPLIGSIRRSNQAPAALLERLNEANTIRNRAPHDKPIPRLSQVTEGDSLQMLNILALVVEWYGENVRLQSKTETIPDSTPIYLSVGGPHRLDQEQFLQHLRAAMRSLGVELRWLTPSQYSPDKPFDQIRSVMSSCHAALIVGLERSHAYAVFEREKSDNQKLYLEQYIPTAWNQIEGSIASALQLPLLVLREGRLHPEGIFEAKNHRHHIHDFDLDVESKGLSADLLQFLTGWIQHVRATLPSQGGEAC